nr:hypothetical protein [Tanacetum cinerariifolium]
LLNDVQNIHEELAEYINTSGWNRPAFYDNDDDDDVDYTIGIAPVLSTKEPVDSLSELMSILNSRIRENLSSTTCVNLPIEDDYSPLLAYVEKSPDLLSHLGFEAFQPSAECPMIINGKNIPLLDVPLFHFHPLDQL